VKALAILAEFPSALPFDSRIRATQSGDFEALVPYWSHTTRPWRLRGAEATLRQAVALKPDDYDSRYNLGFVLAKLGNPQKPASNWRSR